MRLGEAPSVQPPSSREHPTFNSGRSTSTDGAGQSAALCRDGGPNIDGIPQVTAAIRAYPRITAGIGGKERMVDCVWLIVNGPRQISVPLESSGGSNPEISERRKGRQKRGFSMESRIGKMLARKPLRLRSAAVRRTPGGQNVRLLFAFCSLNFLYFFVNELRTRSAQVVPDWQCPAVHGWSAMSGLDRVSPYQQRTKADDGPVWAGLGQAKKPVNPLSVGFGRFACEFKVPRSWFKVERNAECGIKSSCEF